MKTLSLTDTRNKLLEIAEEMERKPSTKISISKHGKPLMMLISTDLYEAILETFAILSDPKAMSSIRKSIRQMKAGKTIPWEKMRTMAEGWQSLRAARHKKAQREIAKAIDGL
jgi:PHD/YefM family antitoxin component YafN of YafNO toxin-antitoxin module